MKRILLLTFVLICLKGGTLWSQSCKDASVELYALVQHSPPQISLNWVSSAGATQYTLYRKLKTSSAWGNAIAILPGTTNQYTDFNVAVGINYEYKVERSASSYTGYGYINTGIEIPAVESRGKLVLLVDSFFVSSCAAGIARLQEDLEGDGWSVIRHNVSRDEAVTSVKSLIIDDYNDDPLNTKAVFMLGHIPVPYSGNINPDGHPDHLGAWPADVYYADVNGTWTDYIVNSTVAGDPRNVNIPGDGKFDQSLIPSDVELQSGRVDFYNLPAFTASEHVLMQNYLDKDHNYRHKIFAPVHRALVDDNFGFFGGEAFAASGWKNFGPTIEPANAVAADYFSSMANDSYLWSYGCGGGWYQGSSGVGSTADFAASGLQGVFTLLFGSYFGDWDSQNNFLRAPLAQGTMLTDAWSGRPHWQFHHMGLGENIGYSTKISQNNNTLYFASYGARFVHIALMGDPTLRNDILAPPSNVIAAMEGNNCNLSWTASTDNVAGYYIYSKDSLHPAYVRLTPNPVAGTTFTDFCVNVTGLRTYMVKAVVLQSTPSGSYFNLSQGVTDTVMSSGNITVVAGAEYTVNDGVVSFVNTSVNSAAYSWNFGDGTFSSETNPIHTYSPGTYTVILIASNNCDSDTLWIILNIVPVFNTIQGIYSYDNTYTMGMPYSIIVLYDSAGNAVGTDTTDIDGNYIFANLPDGVYTLHPSTAIQAGGFNATDALIALKHFVHMSMLTGLKFQAGDVDDNNFINSLDALMISRRFVNQISGFPAGDWYFEEPEVSVSGAVTLIKNVKCICTGDCNGSFIPF